MLNPGIAKTVEWLQSLGFVTTDSGDGETHDYECDRDYPYVVIRCPKSKLIRETERVYAMLLQQLGEKECPAWLHCEGWYNPSYGFGIIEIHDANDKRLGLCESET